MSFIVEERLLENSLVICDLELSRLILKNDKDNPWFVLVPRKRNVTELVDLNSEEQSMLMEEISLVSEFLKEFYRPYKLNVATLGNVVRQLHIHITARFENDRAWPNPIYTSPAVNFWEEAEFHNVKSNFLEFLA